MKSPITTHILDLTEGKPARGVRTVLEVQQDTGEWRRLASGVTDEDGRISDLLPASAEPPAGVYRFVFETEEYFRSGKRETFYPRVTVEFFLGNGDHYHVPLLLSPFGYSTYRGS